MNCLTGLCYVSSNSADFLIRIHAQSKGNICTIYPDNVKININGKCMMKKNMTAQKKLLKAKRKRFYTQSIFSLPKSSYLHDQIIGCIVNLHIIDDVNFDIYMIIWIFFPHGMV